MQEKIEKAAELLEQAMNYLNGASFQLVGISTEYGPMDLRLEEIREELKWLRDSLDNAHYN